jgi:hypothetical protein
MNFCVRGALRTSHTKKFIPEINNADLYRPLLCQALRWPLPTNPQEERELGKALTEYLWRGSVHTLGIQSN